MALMKLVSWVNDHSGDDKPLVVAVENSNTLLVRALWFKPETGESGETLERIPATVKAARLWLGY